MRRPLIQCVHWLVLLILLSPCCLGVNLGYQATSYKTGDKVELLVNKVESDNTQLPFGYYDLPFVCPPGSEPKPLALSLGQILKGDRIWQSNYDLKFGIDAPCLRLCDLMTKDNGLKKADKLIREGYVVHWSVDGLPGATTFVSGNNDNKYYAAGFPLGFVGKDDISYIYNHVMLVIRYHKDKKVKGGYNIVGFEVYPKSVHNELCPGTSKNFKNFALTFEKKVPKSAKEQLDAQPKGPRKTRIPYTYAIYWREDNTIDYDSRWDLYYKGETGKSHHIHWISFINSIVLLVLLSLAVAMVLARVLKSDLQKLSKTPHIPLSDDLQTTTPTSPVSPSTSNWKSLISEVHNRPVFSLILSIFVSSGVQTLIVVVGVITMFTINSQFSLDNSPANMFFNNHQGAFFSLTITFFVMSSLIPSFVGVILHKMFNNEDINDQFDTPKYVRLSILFSGFLPILIATIIFTLNFFVWAKSSSYAIPFGTFIVLILIFFVFQLPLGVIGGYYGNRTKFDKKSFILTFFNEKKNGKDDDKPNWKSKKIGKLPLFLQPVLSTVVFGLIPFGIVYVELLFILNSMWLEKTTFYFMYGFLLVTILVIVVVIAESTILACYMSLAIYQNPNWHWLCFRVGSSIGWYIFAYSFYYFFCILNVRDFVSILLYFAYMSLVSGLIALACGSVGLITGFVFISKIYGTVKLD